MKIIIRLMMIYLAFTICSCKMATVKETKAETAANEPTIKKEQTFSYSESTKPKPFDFICFLGEAPGLRQKYLTVYRLCGMPGDVVQIKNGNFYLNNKMVDTQFSLKHNYLITKQEFERLKTSISIDDNYLDRLEGDTLNIPLEDKFVANNKIRAKRNILLPTTTDSSISHRYSQNWNQDNFGPIEVPKSTYFVLGDNRNNAWDSRYRGFIDEKDFLGTVVPKK